MDTQTTGDIFPEPSFCELTHSTRFFSYFISLDGGAGDDDVIQQRQQTAAWPEDLGWKVSHAGLCWLKKKSRLNGLPTRLFKVFHGNHFCFMLWKIRHGK